MTDQTIEDWKYQISLALPEGLPDNVISNVYDIVETELAAVRAEQSVEAALAEMRKIVGGNEYVLIQQKHWFAGDENGSKVLIVHVLDDLTEKPLGYGTTLAEAVTKVRTIYTGEE